MKLNVWMLCGCLALISPLCGGETSIVATRAEEAGSDFPLQGEYVGEINRDGAQVKFGVQILAQGDGKFHGVGYAGGLPGDGWDGSERIEGDGQREGDAAVFGKEEVVARVQDGEIRIQAGGITLGVLKKVERKSPTLGATAPAGAVVLFDGKSADQFAGGKVTDDGLLLQGVTSKVKFQSYTLHLEFQLPYMPAARGQGRGNSGCYAQGRYEVQILDSFGLEGLNNECGGIYSVKAPSVNMCFPPLAWQTYDIDFTAAKYDADGKKTADARLTVKHNGVEIHKDVVIPKATTAAPVAEGPEPGPLYLQDHGNPVRFRNIWVVEKK